jgi:hypothetical protein
VQVILALPARLTLIVSFDSCCNRSFERKEVQQRLNRIWAGGDLPTDHETLQSVFFHLPVQPTQEQLCFFGYPINGGGPPIRSPNKFMNLYEDVLHVVEGLRCAKRSALGELFTRLDTNNSDTIALVEVMGQFSFAEKEDAKRMMHACSGRPHTSTPLPEHMTHSEFCAQYSSVFFFRSKIHAFHDEPIAREWVPATQEYGVDLTCSELEMLLSISRAIDPKLKGGIPSVALSRAMEIVKPGELSVAEVDQARERAIQLAEAKWEAEKERARIGRLESDSAGKHHHHHHHHHADGDREQEHRRAFDTAIDELIAVYVEVRLLFILFASACATLQAIVVLSQSARVFVRCWCVCVCVCWATY